MEGEPVGDDTLVSFSLEELSCSLKESCSGASVMRLSGSFNAHGATAANRNYKKIVCCSGLSNPGTASGADSQLLLKLSSAESACRLSLLTSRDIHSVNLRNLWRYDYYLY